MKRRAIVYKVLWTKNAELDVREALDFISQDNPSAARSLYRRIRTDVSGLSRDPERCRTLFELDDIGLAGFRELLIKPYRVIVKIVEHSVFILGFIDGRRDLETVLFRRLIRPPT